MCGGAVVQEDASWPVDARLWAALKADIHAFA